ncbi:MurR/RpiR family transcriptional regulator [Intestinimonas butyriciproducens]|nr:MurR/RpiR family transcriptional regulator [Intestinimonas butyriciproducens]
MNVIERIQEKYGDMTRKQRVLADYMLENPDSMSFMTMKNLSGRTQVSEMTILNYCTALGYGNYNELKYEFRKYINERNKIEVQRQNEYLNASVPEYELDDKQNLLYQVCQEEFDLLKLLFAHIDIPSLFQGAEMMLDADCTVFCARGVSLQIADFLSMRLATMGLPSIVMNTELNDSVQSALPLLKGGTLLVPISLPDYYVMTTKVCEFARQRRCRILALTDSKEQSPVAPFGDLVLTAPASSRLFLNSPGGLLVLAHLLSAALNIEKSARHTSKFCSPQEFSQVFTKKMKGSHGNSKIF